MIEVWFAGVRDGPPEGGVVRSRDGAGASEASPAATRRQQGDRAMRPFQGYAWGCALAALALTHAPAQAAWNNVFQVCCHHCRSAAPAPAVAMYAAAAAPAPAVAAYADPCAPQCPQTTCTTRYVQRCYYQPVTTYRVSTY